MAEEDYPRWLRRCVEATLKGFAIGSGLKGGLALLSTLVRLRSLLTGGRGSKKSAATNAAEVVLREANDTLRHGMFLGPFAGTYVSVDECIAAVWGRNRTAKWMSFLAGLIAGPTMLLTGLKTRHTSLATYILVRAGVHAARCGMKSRRFGKLCKPLAWSQGDIFIMCLSSAQNASAYILDKDSFPPSYKAFLAKQIGKDPIVLQGLKELVNNNALTSLPRIEEYYKTVGVELKLDPKMKVPCSILHGNQSCTGHFFLILATGVWKSSSCLCSSVFDSCTCTSLLTSACKALFNMGKNILGVARSSLFLSVYCASQWGWTCLLLRIFNRCNIPLLVLGTFPTGLALLIEKKNRRIEISLYCLARAIESFSACIADAGLFPVTLQIKRPDIVVFSIATSIIMHCYAQEKGVFRSKYLDVLDWVFGSHAPSNYKKCSPKS